MLYQLFHSSPERMKKFPLNKPYILAFSTSEKALNLVVGRLKKSDPKIKEITGIQDKKPKINEDTCLLVPGTQADAEDYRKG